MNRSEQISEIKRILRECCNGRIAACDIEPESSPCILCNVNDKPIFSVLAEAFGDDVEVSTYVGEKEISTGNVDYDDLSDDIIDEIYNLLEQYEVGLEKTFKRCED